MFYNEYMDTEKIEQISIGKVIPEINIKTYNPKINAFSEFSLKKSKDNGRWTVFVFYPADYTFVCPTELADYATKQEELEKIGVDIVSISTDTEFVHMAWKREEKLLKDVNFQMGADHNGSVSKMFGVYDYNTGEAYRGTFIIDPNLVLVSSEINLNNVGRDADELTRKVKAFIYVSLHPHEVCPAKWSKGHKTLKPEETTIGNVSEFL